MPVIFNKDTNKENQPNPNEIINKIIKVIKELEQTIIDNKRTINSKVNGNNFSMTEKIRTFNDVIQSVDTRVSIIGERTPEELTTEPVKELIKDGYTSIQVKCSSEILNKATELNFADNSLSTRLSDEVKNRESTILSLATNIISFDERNGVKFSTLESKIDTIRPSGPNNNSLDGLSNRIDILIGEVNNLKKNVIDLSGKLDKETYTEMRQRVDSIKSVEARLTILGG
tara:strand:- start:3722 stop:4408 length:687 start_codon:yes stop_codon:yes gene_type:complete